VFDDTLYSDYADAAKTTKTPINWQWYSKMMTPAVTGLEHLWDDILIEAKQHNVNSTVDVEVNLDYAQYTAPSVLKTTIFIVGVTPIGEGQIANPNLTDIVNNAKQLPIRLRGKYAQVKLTNNRDEPVEIFNLKLLVRPMTQY
jgi:hypothetical protein